MAVFIHLRAAIRGSNEYWPAAMPGPGSGATNSVIITGRRRCHSIFDGRVFVPFKLRLARITGDASYGYIELSFVSRIVPVVNGKCQLILSNGECLPVFSQITTARLALYFGLEIQKNHLQPEPDQELLQAFRVLRRYLISGSTHQ